MTHNTQEGWRDRFMHEFGRGGFGDTEIFPQVESFITSELEAARREGAEQAVEFVKRHGYKQKDGKGKIIGYAIGAGDLEEARLETARHLPVSPEGGSN